MPKIVENTQNGASSPKTQFNLADNSYWAEIGNASYPIWYFYVEPIVQSLASLVRLAQTHQLIYANGALEMGLLVKGVWSSEWYDTKANKGEFIRTETQFRSAVGEEQFPLEHNRFHLFVSLACPWAHRTLIFRTLKGLENIIGVTVVRPEMLENGWVMDNELSVSLGYSKSPVEDIEFLRELYLIADPVYTGRVTVPVLWDLKKATIVNNESSDIIKAFNSAFAPLIGETYDYYPVLLREEIDSLNNFIYENINNGVYRAGFATSQGAYERAFTDVFEALDNLEKILDNNRFLLGSKITEVDWRLFTTLIRFDSVYYTHFKTNKKRIEDYPNLSNYLRELFQIEGISQTVDFEQIKRHYFYSHETINPHRIVPAGPDLDYSRPFVRSPSNE